MCSGALRPDLVLKMETMSADLLAYLSPVGLAGFAADYPHLVVGRGGTHTSQVARHYYGMLDGAKVAALHEFYSVDHELFGYGPDAYLDYARSHRIITKILY